MIKEALRRGYNGFSCAITVNVIIFLVMCLCSKDLEFAPVVPEYAEFFHTKLQAVLMEILLCGVVSAVFSAGSVIMEAKRMSLVMQSVIFFLVTAAVWIPVGCFCWRIHKHLSSMISVICSYTCSYIVTWVIQYRVCKASVKEINEKLKDMQEENK